MEKSPDFYRPVFGGIAAIVAGALLIAINGILGFAVIIAGAAMICWPLMKGRAPKAVLEDGKLHITGAFADWILDVDRMENVHTVDSIKVAVMTLGYGGHRYIGGEFVEDSLGGIHIAADKKIGTYIVLDCEDRRYVFNCVDRQTTDSLYGELRSLSASE